LKSPSRRVQIELERDFAAELAQSFMLRGLLGRLEFIR
jgi:hypothetical protein